MVFTVGVSCRIAVTVAICHCSGCHMTSSLPLFSRYCLLVGTVTLLLPGICVDSIAERFPEPALVGVHQPQSAHPLGASPEVECRHDQPGGATMFRRKR